MTTPNSARRQLKRWSVDPYRLPVEQRPLVASINDAGPLFANVELITTLKTNGEPKAFKIRVTRAIPPRGELYLVYGEDYWSEQWKAKGFRWIQGSYPKEFIQFSPVTNINPGTIIVTTATLTPQPTFSTPVQTDLIDERLEEWFN